jgi:Zn-dependent peptidase ImmA (M78 family)
MAKAENLTEVIRFGHPDELGLVLIWRDDYGSDGPVGRTWGELQLWIHSTLVWGSWNNAVEPTGVRWSWIDLLEFLAIAWGYLQEEETYPIDFITPFDTPRHLGELRGRAKLRWRNLSEEDADREDEQLRDFLAVHDFGEALQGAFPPSLIFLRQGRQMLAATRLNQWALDFARTLDTLEELGETIARQIEGLDDERSTRAMDRWSARNSLEPTKRLEMATGLSSEELREAWPTPLEDSAVGTQDYGLKAAARMIGRGLPSGVMRDILTKIARLPYGALSIPEDVQELADDLLSDLCNEEPYTQGYNLALSLRAHIGAKTGRTEPEALLGTWSVAVEEFEIEAEHLDAIAVWSEHHRPTVLINTRGLRSRFPSGRRSTCAHEICHLLVDRESALPAVEVLGGRISHDIEQRANAFAAEFLLPRAEAGRLVKKSLEYVYSPDERELEIHKVVSHLADTYNVSYETAAWQLLRSRQIGEREKSVLQGYLKSILDPYQ